MLPSASSSMLILLSLTIRFFQITDYQIPTFFTRKLSLWIANSLFQNTDIMNCQQFLPEYWHCELPTVSSRILTLWNSNSFFQNTDLMNCQQFLPEYWYYELPTVSSRILTLWIANSFFQNTDIMNYQQFLPEYWHYKLPSFFQNTDIMNYQSLLPEYWHCELPIASSRILQLSLIINRFVENTISKTCQHLIQVFFDLVTNPFFRQNPNYDLPTTCFQNNVTLYWLLLPTASLIFAFD